MGALQPHVAQNPLSLEKRGKATPKGGPFCSAYYGQVSIKAQIRLEREESRASHLAGAPGTQDTVYLLSIYCHF